MFKSKLKKWLGNAVTVLLLVIGLAVWISLPWIGVLAVAVLVALWLLLTRGGRLALAATRIGVASLPQRWGASSVIVVGIAGVVGVLVAMLAMGEGFQATLNNTGDDTTAIVLRGGSQAETNSVITREQVPTLSTLPGISRDAQGRPLLSPELSQVVNLVSKSDGTDVNAQFRGVGPQAWAVHDKVKIIEGRKFATGLREIVVGQGAKGQFRDMDVGKTLTLGNQTWTVVGVFATGDAHDSELWTDADTLATTYQRSAWQSISVRTDGKAGFEQFKAAVAADPRLKLDVETTRVYYSKQGGGLTKLNRHPRQGDRHDHGGGCGVRRTQHHVCRRGHACARDRHHACDWFPRPAGGDCGDAGDDAAGAARWPARVCSGVAAVQWLQRVHHRQQFQRGGVQVPRVAGTAVDRPEVGVGHRPGWRPVPRAARGAIADHHGAARNLSITQRYNAHPAGGRSEGSVPFLLRIIHAWRGSTDVVHRM
jgi:MacB-like periplasmic core domain